MLLPENFNELINDYLNKTSQELESSQTSDPPAYPVIFASMVSSACFVCHNIHVAEQGEKYTPSELDDAVYNKLLFDMCGSGVELMERDQGLYMMACDRYQAIRLIAAKCMECGGEDGDE